MGDPLPPALNIPAQIQDLRAVQRGDRIVVEFTPSMEATDKVVLKNLSAIDLRIGPQPEGGWNVFRWADEAKKIPVADPKAGPREVIVPASSWIGKEVVISVRSVGPTGRPAQWSGLVTLNIVQPVPAPTDIAIIPDPRGLYVNWKGEGQQWRVWRKPEGAKDPEVLGVSGERAWMDFTAEMGKSYQYMVQALVPGGTAPAESEIAETAAVKFVDKFPPSVPTALTAIQGIKTVELNWQPSPEPDVKHYQIWRALDDAELKKFGDPAPNPSFSDANVEIGKKYRYAVSAIDDNGNESPPCAPVEITAPSGG